MEMYMKGIGKMIWLMGLVVLFMQMKTFILENGRTIKPMVLVLTSIQMVLNTKEIGLKTNNMVKGKKFGLIMLAIKVHT